MNANSVLKILGACSQMTRVPIEIGLNSLFLQSNENVDLLIKCIGD